MRDDARAVVTSPHLRVKRVVFMQSCAGRSGPPSMCQSAIDELILLCTFMRFGHAVSTTRLPDALRPPPCRPALLGQTVLVR